MSYIWISNGEERKTQSSEKCDTRRVHHANPTPKLSLLLYLSHSGTVFLFVTVSPQKSSFEGTMSTSPHPGICVSQGAVGDGVSQGGGIGQRSLVFCRFFLGLFGQRQILVYGGLSLKSKDGGYSTVNP